MRAVADLEPRGAALLRERDRRRRPAGSAPRADGLPARRALDDEDLLERRQTKTQQQTNAAIALERAEAAASASWTPWGGSARGRSGPRRKLLCPLVINQTITYVDRGHVSQTYALELAQPFRIAFRAQLFR